MDDPARKEVEAQIDRIDKLNEQVKNFERYNLVNTSDKLSTARGSLLMAAIFATIGMTLALIATMMTNGLLLLTIPLWTIAAGAIGVLVWRGRDRIRRDRIAEELKNKQELIIFQLKDLPNDAPSHVQNELWETYLDLIKQQRELAAGILPKQLPHISILPEASRTVPQPVPNQANDSSNNRPLLNDPDISDNVSSQ